ncbi:MAG: molybdopterin-guanine dinucleotide biosynthesis protein B [Gemmatimonadota bacterium]|nr:MAG: molybdopterin-guanine dinucleotide biosynthesis protein B [Gemmatimonadota bacterium]
MKVIGIVGFKKSGKTSLAVNLCQELRSRGFTVAVIKHSDSNLTPADVDSTKMIECSGQGAALSDSETVISFQEVMPLEEVLKFFRTDIAVIEGFKDEKTYPKIVCLRDETEAKNLFDGLQICVVGSGEDLSVPLVSDIHELADLVLEKSFKLPRLDCGACGFDTCYELAKAIVMGEKTVEDCASLQGEVDLRIDGEILPLNPFIARMISNTIIGLLSSLRGFRTGSIEMTIEK